MFSEAERARIQQTAAQQAQAAHDAKNLKRAA